jgi:hypothetical protein
VVRIELIDVLGLGAVALVAAEWIGLGWLSGISFPVPGASGANWALRLLVGACLVAIVQLVLAAIGIGFASIPTILLVAAAGAAGLRLLAGRTADTECKHVPVGTRGRTGWYILGVVLMAAVIRSVVVPEAGWDAYSHWGLRAQAFATAGTIVDAHSEHEYYPPLVPLLEAWLYLHRGAASIDLAKVIWALVGSGLAICLGWHLRLSLHPVWLAPYAAVGVVLGATALLESFWTGQADLALTAWLTLAVLSAWQWQRAQNRAWLFQTAIFSAAAALTKFEGLPRVGVVVAALLVEALIARQWRLWRPATVLAACAVVASAVWTVVELTHAIAPNGEHVGAFQPLAIGSVLVGLLAVFGGIRTGGGILVAVLAWIVSGARLIAPPLRPLALIVVGQAVATLIAFLVSSTSPDVEVRTSATRLFEQFLPLALFVGAVGVGELHL